MANEFARNILDASLNPATFTLPSALSLSVTSAVVDLGTDTFDNESFEVELAVPSLTSTMAPSTATAGVIYIIETSTTSTFVATARTIYSKTQVPVATAGVPATTARCRVPSDCERYIRGKITFGATTADASTLAATLSLRF